MSLLAGKLNQTATVWEVASRNEDGSGEPVFASDSPRTISVRWEERVELFADGAGQERRSNAVIFVDEDLAEGDWIALGEFEVSDPTTLVAARQIQQMHKIPQLSGNEYVRKLVV